MVSIDNNTLEFLQEIDFSNCLVCGTCANGCPTTGAPGLDGLDARTVMRLIANGCIDEVVASNFPWLCTGCGRCAANCPSNIDVTGLMSHLKGLRSRDKIPGTLHQGMLNNLETGNNLAISQEEYLESMADLGNELSEECCPGFYVPIDKHDADILFFPNSKEVYGDFEDQFWWWKIFYAAKESWTVPGKNWEAVDWALFTGNNAANKELAQRKIDYMKQYGIRRMIMPDCGGGSYGCRKGMSHLAHENPANQVGFLYLYDYLIELFEQGRITVDKSINAGKTFTFHDSCKHGRELERSFGKGYYEEPRWIIQQCVDDYVELTPNRDKNYCCGAGGGMWPMPFEDQSAWHARYKHQQITNSGAHVVVVGCSNCRDQLQKRIPKHFEGCDYEVKYIWQLVAESLIIKPWSENEIDKNMKAAQAQWDSLGVTLDDLGV